MSDIYIQIMVEFCNMIAERGFMGVLTLWKSCCCNNLSNSILLTFGDMLVHLHVVFSVCRHTKILSLSSNLHCVLYFPFAVVHFYLSGQIIVASIKIPREDSSPLTVINLHFIFCLYALFLQNEISQFGLFCKRVIINRQFIVIF